MTICLIPARGGSRRIPKKNIRPFFGKPIIAYSIKTAKAAGCDVVVSTDDDEIAAVAKEFGADLIHWRAPDMARDDVGTQVVAQLVLNDLCIARVTPTIVLYPCAPLVTAEDLRGATPIYGFGVSVGIDPLRDAGAFYCGQCDKFRALDPLYDRNTTLIVLPEERVCDINTDADWEEATRKYAALHEGEI